MLLASLGWLGLDFSGPEYCALHRPGEPASGRGLAAGQLGAPRLFWRTEVGDASWRLPASRAAYRGAQRLQEQSRAAGRAL